MRQQRGSFGAISVPRISALISRIALTHPPLTRLPADVLGVNSSTLDAPMGDIISITASDCPAKCEARRR